MNWHKYKAKPVVIDGIRFHSKKEGRRYRELQLLEKAGEIKNLELQPKYPLEIGGMTIGKYIGDFRYWEDGNLVVEDCKGMRLPLYILKKKLLRALYGIEIRET